MLIFFLILPNPTNCDSNETPAESSEALNLQSDEDKIINNDNHNHNSGGENDLKLNDENSDNNNNKDNVKDANENKGKG